MDKAQAKENENCRGDILEYLGARPSVAQSAETIHRRLSKENPQYSLEDVTNALEFLLEAELLKSETNELGSTKYFQVSAKGSLYIERNFGL